MQPDYKKTDEWRMDALLEQYSFGVEDVSRRMAVIALIFKITGDEVWAKSFLDEFDQTVRPSVTQAVEKIMARKRSNVTLKTLTFS
jgi:hypothetical protein